MNTKWANYRLVTPAWARDFDNSTRHCWITTEGIRKINGYPYDECTEEHDPKLAGVVEWLRFVREFGAILPGPNPFASEDGKHFLFIEPDGHPTSDGRRTFCETYLRKLGDSWGLDPVFRVFLAHREEWARIECYDEDLVGACEQALTQVEKSYGVTFA